MRHKIGRASASYLREVATCDFSFLVQGAYVPEFGKPIHEWAVQPLVTHRTGYGSDVDELKGHLSSEDKALFIIAQND